TVSGYLTQNNSMHRVVLSSAGNTSTSAGSEAHPEQRALPDVDAALPVSWDSVSESAATSRVSVPFYCAQDIEGMVVVDIHPASLYDKTESERVLLAVSEQLSLFNNKLTAREQAQQARLMGERSRLAGDMHDSLAQTLLAARYKATLLHEELSETGESAWSDDVQKIAAAISEANQEIRELIREYRSPLADHRPVDSIQESIEQFRQSSGLQVFFQNKDQHLRFTPREELVVQRIIGEALINAEKYAKPTTIRVFMQYLANGSRTVLIEDDGAGFDVEAMISQSQENKVDSGEHIGLSIMQERALSIGAILTIESEPGDGTRVSLQLPPLVEPARKVL
ncbi:MAG: hypothetical protein KTR32_16020, partial [Granulosicoccus sp.]|nr:hypothetical protein [Granulosicoccus sp.]